MAKNKLEKILLWPDTHIPYHDKKAVDLILKVAKKWKPDTIVLGGDFIDNYSVSSHDRDPNRSLKLDIEVEETIKYLKIIKELKAKKNIFIAGNHEWRLERYLMSVAPELNNIVSIHGCHRQARAVDDATDVAAETDVVEPEFRRLRLARILLRRVAHHKDLGAAVHGCSRGMPPLSR